MNTPPILLKATLVFLLNKTSSSRLFLIISETIETGRSIGLVILIINLKYDRKFRQISFDNMDKGEVLFKEKRNKRKRQILLKGKNRI